MGVFILPKRFTESERVQDLLTFMESDIQNYYDMLEYLYDWTSLDDSTDEYMEDVGAFLGSTSVKFKYSEENKVKWLRNYISLIKYIGSPRTINTVLMTYSFPVDIKYKWTNDFVDYTEYDVDDLLYGYGQLKYLSSFLLVRFNMQDTFEAAEVSGTNFAVLDLDNVLQYEKTWQLRVEEELITDDPVKATALAFKAGDLQERTYIVDTSQSLETQAEYRALISVYSDVDLEGRFFTLGESVPQFPVRIFPTYSNLVTDSQDLSTVNWSETDASATLMTDQEVLGLPMSRVDITAGNGYVSQEVAYTGSGRRSFQVIVREGTDDEANLEIFDTSSSTSLGKINIEWDAGSGTSLITVSGTGVVVDSVWLDDTTVELYAKTASATTTNTHEIRLTGKSSGSYQLWTAVGAYDREVVTPYVETTATGAAVVKSLNLSEDPINSYKVTIDMKIRPWFTYDHGTNMNLFEWAGDASHSLWGAYGEVADRFYLVWQDGGTQRTMNTVAIGSSPNTNEWMRFTFSVDLASSTATGSTFWVDGTAVDSIWSGGIDAGTSTDLGSLGICCRASGTGLAETELEYFRVYDGTSQQVDIDNDFINKTLLLEYPLRENADWGTATALGWRMLSEDLDLLTGSYVYGFGWEFRRFPTGGGGNLQYPPLGASTIKLADPSVVKITDYVLMETELYQNLSADVGRFRMVHQVFDYETQLYMDFESQPYGWENLFSDVWIWKNSTYMRTLYAMDTGLILDTAGLTTDLDLASVLEAFDEAYFGAGAGAGGSDIHDVASPLFNNTGIVEVDTSAKVYTFKVSVEDESFTFINEVAVRDSSNNVLFYLVHPKIEKTGDKIYWIFRMDYSAE